MVSVDQMILDILRREGGYVNDPDDPGGATKYGVTIGTMRRLNVDVDGDGDVDIADVKALTIEQAHAIYKQHYFVRPRIAELPSVLRANVFDMQVNAGGNAIRILQRMLALFGRPVKVDGTLGPQTIGAANSAAGDAPDHISDAYAIERRKYYFALANRRPASRKYARTRAGDKGGWIKRCEEFMRPKYRLTNAEFRAKISRW